MKVRYKQTLLGAAWAVLQPALMMVVFTIFFSRMARVTTDGFSEAEYPLFVFAGLLPWTFFATAVSNAGNSVVGSERLITKVYFPRLAIPFATVGAALVDFAVASGLMAVLMLWFGRAPGWGLLLAPLFVGLMTLLAVGVGAFLAALNVSYRDFRYVIPFLVQVWMYATPTVYSQPTGAELGGWLHALMALNPMTALVAGFRSAVVGGPIDWSQVGVAAAVERRRVRGRLPVLPPRRGFVRGFDLKKDFTTESQRPQRRQKPVPKEPNALEPFFFFSLCPL